MKKSLIFLIQIGMFFLFDFLRYTKFRYLIRTQAKLKELEILYKEINEKIKEKITELTGNEDYEIEKKDVIEYLQENEETQNGFLLPQNIALDLHESNCFYFLWFILSLIWCRNHANDKDFPHFWTF